MVGIVCNDLMKRYGDVVAIERLNLDIQDGEFIVLLGPSGCGKTTTLNIIAGLEELTEGNLLFDNVPVTFTPPHKRNVAMVFQSYALYPQKTVYENIAFPLRLRRMARPECDRLVLEVAEQLEITHLLDRRPNQLSGGQRQRVALGRAIVRKPSVFLMDEPLSNLDATLRISMRALIKKLHFSVATTFVYVTHDQAEAMTLADRIVVMDKGLVQQIGTPDEIYNSPCNMFVAAFLGSPQMNFIEGYVAGDGNRLAFSTPTETMPLSKRWNGSLTGRQGSEMVLGVRPEDITLAGDAPDDIEITGRCLLTAPLGSETYVYVVIGENELVLRANKDSVPAIGQDVTLRLRGDRIHLFDSGSGEAVPAATVG